MNIPALKLMTAFFFLSVLSVPVHALTPDRVFDKVKDSVVVVKSMDAQGKMKGFGSGVLISADRVATNCHVVKGGASYQVGRGKQLVSATLYAEDGDKDICILDAKGITGQPAQLGKAANLKVGVPVYAVGAPQGLELSLSDGIVSQIRGGPPPLIQTTAAVSPGSSGGGLFDGEGRLIGLTTLYLEGGQSLNFAMPVEWIGEIKPGHKEVARGRSQIEWLKRVLALSKLNDWQGLVDWCLKWTKSEPEDAEAWFHLGFAYSNIKRYNDAIEAYHQALRIDPKNARPIIWVSLGVAYDGLKRYQDAIKAYRQAISINPEDAKAWSFLGSSYHTLKQYDDAIKAYRQAISINPEYAAAWSFLGDTYHTLKQYDDANEAFRQSLRIDPKNAIIWKGFGNTCRGLNRNNAAIEAYRQALHINPECFDTWILLGDTYYTLNRHGDAVMAYRQALSIKPKNADAWEMLALAYALSGNRAAALDAVKELRHREPARADKLFNMIVPR